MTVERAVESDVRPSSGNRQEFVESLGSHKPRTKKLMKWEEYLCGWGAAFINVTITYPLNKLIFRQMLHGVGVGSALGQLSNEGIYYLYRGMLPPFCQKTLSLSLMFGVYEECLKPLEEAKCPHLVAKTTAAIVAGVVEGTLMPFERVQTLLQHHTYHSEFRNTFHAFGAIGVNYGFKEYYRGLVPILLRNAGANVMFFILRDEAKLYLPTHSKWWAKMSQEFMSGAIIGAFISTIIYPLNVAKVQLQSKLGGDYQGFVSVLEEIRKERGVRNMYRGVHLNYTRAFISWGVINVAYEFLKGLIH